MTDVIVIGGGASGMMAALTAAENGRSVVLLERQSRVGRKLLATGNGRCNLTNYHVSPDHYHGEDSSFCAHALCAFDTGTTLQYFASLGLLTVSEDSGRVYPMSNMAGSVLDVLRYALERPGIRVCTGQAVTAVKRIAEGFTVRTETEVFAARKVILAAGGAAGSKVGGVMDGYRLAKMLGHHRTVLYPSLVQLRTDPTYPRALKGIKAECGIAILRGDERVAENRGEVLFTEYGVSGPAIFDISRTVSTGGEGLVCALDFFPDWEPRDVLDWLRLRREAMGTHEASTLLVGSCHTRLGQMLCKSAGFTSQRAADLTDGDLERIARQVKRFALPITGTCGFDQAQVTAGCGRRNSIRKRWKAVSFRGCTPAARCWTWTATAAASTCNGPGHPGIWPGCCCNKLTIILIMVNL
jgi:predicted Rossmann fold flavoprotein